MAKQENHALIFPGQGSQEPGMGKFLLTNSDPQISKPAQLLFEEGSDILGQNLVQLCLEAEKDTLDQTINAQPAIVMTSIAAFSALRDKKVLFNAVAGHSVGELPALYAAESLTLKQVLNLTKLRAELMAKAGKNNPGKMAAVLNIPSEEIELFCKVNNLYLANDNSDTQVVISGSSDGIKRLATEYPFERKRATGSIILPVSIASHCPFMKDAKDGLTRALREEKILDPRSDVIFIANTTGEPIADGETMRDLIPNQLISPVLWRQSIQYLNDRGIRKMTEVGYGNVQQKLIRRAHPDIEIVSFEKHLTV